MTIAPPAETATAAAAVDESATPTAPASLPPTPRSGLDAAVAAVAAQRAAWAAAAIGDRIRLLDRLTRDFLAVAPRWAAAAAKAEGLEPDSPGAGEEWLTGPYLVIRNLRLLREALEDVDETGAPEIPGAVTTRPDGRVVAEVFPASLYDRLFFPGVGAEVWMEPGVTVEGLAETQAVAYRKGSPGAVALVLGAGNVSSIGPMDVLYKLFVEHQVVVLKAHPVNAYLGPLLEEGFAALIERDLLRVVYGGAEEGAYLCDHPDVDTIHVTGSDRTYEAIVFGTGEDGRRRKAEGRPRIAKPVTAELGNVSPVIVVPGPWSAGDLAYQAENLAAMLVNNAGFNCNAARVIVQHAGWDRREALLDAIRTVLARVPPRKAYYPGAAERFDELTAAHPETERFGRRGDGRLPWALIPGLDPRSESEPLYRFEAFNSLFAETALEAASPAEFVDRAVEFANDRLWGTLSATLIVDSAALRDAATRDAVERAIAGLRYGTVTLNHWAGVGYGLVVTPWGAYPGHPPHDIQSGTGVVHNSLMFSRPEKTVVRSPFRAFPKPPWFPSHRADRTLAEALTRFEASPSPFRLPGVFWPALRG
jgi:hypothetical protein